MPPSHRTAELDAAMTGWSAEMMTRMGPKGGSGLVAEFSPALNSGFCKNRPTYVILHGRDTRLS